MEFKYVEKETYTLAELKALLSQHGQKLTKSMVSKEEYQKLMSELEPLKNEKRNNHIHSLTKNLKVKNELVGDLIKLSNISDEMNDDDIVKSFKETLKTRSWLQDTEDSQSVLTTGKKPEPEQTKKTYKWVTT